MSSTIHLHALSNYTFGTKDPIPDTDPSIAARLQRLEHEYTKTGQRTTIDAVLVVHEHEHPHILLLHVNDSYYKLPGGEIEPGNSDALGLGSRLEEVLGGAEWDVGDLVGTLYR